MLRKRQIILLYHFRRLHIVSIISQDSSRPSELHSSKISNSTRRIASRIIAIHLAIHFASSKTIVSSVNYEVDRLERGLKREGIRVTVTVSDHCEGYYGRHYEEHCGEANRVV